MAIKYVYRKIKLRLLESRDVKTNALSLKSSASKMG